MKKTNLIFTFLFFYCLIISYSQEISTRVLNSKIILEFDLNRYTNCGKSEITAFWSNDGGKNYEKLCCTQGNIGVGVSNGMNKSITWNVMDYTNGKPFVESNVIFHIHQKTCYQETNYGSLSYSDDLYSKAKSFNISASTIDEPDIPVPDKPVSDKPKLNLKIIEDSLSVINKLFKNALMKYEGNNKYFMIDNDGNKIYFFIKEVGVSYQYDSERGYKNLIQLFCDNCIEFQKYEKDIDKEKQIYRIPEKWSLFRLEFDNKENAIRAEGIFKYLKNLN